MGYIKKIIFCISLLSLSSMALSQSSVDVIKQKSLTRAQQDSVVNKATSTGGGEYINPKLKDATKKDAAQDQYDCDSTCLAMGGNKNSTKTITENKTERCPSGFRDPKGNSFIVTATRTVTTKYSGNTVTSTSYSDWVPSANSISCIQEETRTPGCSGGMTGEKTEARTNYYNGSYTWGTWSITKDTCACPNGTYYDSTWGACMHSSSGGGGGCGLGNMCCIQTTGSSYSYIYTTCSNGDCCVSWNKIGEVACVTHDGQPGRAETVSNARAAWEKHTFTPHDDGTGSLYVDIGPIGPWSEPRVFGCVAN